jgi:large subunit ribosomal protein L4
MPRRAVQAATRMAMATKVQSGQLVVIDELSFAEPRTKEMAGVLKALGLAGHSTLVTTESFDRNVYRSARNIDRVSVSPVGELNALAILTPRRVLATRAALDAFRQRAGQPG